MGDEASKEVFWDDAVERLTVLFSHLRGIIPNSPNPSLPDTKAEDIYKSLKSYQGDEKEVHHFAKMDPKTFYALFATWQQLRK